jgi:3-dehydroquinate synthetase
LPTHCPPFYVDDILLATTHDKKRRGPALRWALPYGIGDVRIVEAVPPDLVRAVLIKLGAKGPT